MSVRKWVEAEVIRALASDNLRPKRFGELREVTRHRVRSKGTLRKCLVQLCVLGMAVENRKSHKNVEYRLANRRFIDTGSWKTEEPTHLVYEIMELIMRAGVFDSIHERFQIALGFASYFYFRWDLLPAIVAYLPHQYFMPSTDRKLMRRHEWIERFFFNKRFFEMIIEFCDKYPNNARKTSDYAFEKMTLNPPLSGESQINRHMVNVAFELLQEFLQAASRLHQLGFRPYPTEVRRLKASESTMKASVYRKLK